MPDRGDVLIQGKPYRIDLNSYRVADLVDFAPRAATPGGSILHSELGLYQPLLQTDWRHGFGFPWYTDSLGFMRSEGDMDTRHAGVVMRFTQRASSDTNNNRKDGFAVFNNKLWSYGVGGGVRRFDGSWLDSGAYTNVNFLLATGSYLFICVDNGRIRKMSTAEAHSDAGLDVNATDYKWGIIHNGFFYFGKDATSRVHFSDKEDLNDLEGTTTDPDVIYIGAGGYATVGAVVYGGKLYIFRPDGVWHLDEARIARRVLDFSDQVSTTNFRSWAVHNGLLIFPIRDKLFQWNGARLSDITPPRLNDLFPYTTYGLFDNLVAVGRFLFLTARTNEATYKQDLLCYDGVGWHRLSSLITDGAGDITAMYFDTVNNRLWHHLDTVSDITYEFTFQSLSEFPVASFASAGTHSLISSRLDMGFRRVKKSTPSILVEGSNLTASTFLRVYYSLDGGVFTLWGDITTNGITELINPGGGNSVEYFYITIRVDFITSVLAQTPVLEGLTLRFIMRPDVSYGHSMNIIGAGGAQYETALDERTAKNLSDDLRTARDSKAPIAFVDPYGTTRQVYLSSLQERAVERHVEDNEGNVPNIERVIQVNLVEVG